MPWSRWAAITAMAALVGGACAPVAPGAQSAPTQVVRVAAPASNDLVLVSTPRGLAAFDWSSRRLVYQATSAVPTPDWSQLLVTDQANLNVLDGRTGAHKASVAVPPGLVAAAVSTDGRRVALGPASDDNPWLHGREQTRVVVADPSGAVQPRTFDLQGNYVPDAFANDDRHLFVLEYQPPLLPQGYRVRVLDLNTGAVSGVGSRSKEVLPEETMRGTRRAHVLSPDRQTLYTLYTNQPEHLHSRDLSAGLDRSSGDVFAFVHVLSLAGGWAYCLDLPQPFGVGPASAHSLALSADGRWLYVSDRSSGKVAITGTELLNVTSVADVGADPGAGSASASMQIGPDGSLFMSSSSEVLVLEPKTLAVQRRLPLPEAPTGLGVSPDGQRLFISTSDRLVAIDPHTGLELGGFVAPGAQRIEHVGRL